MGHLYAEIPFAISSTSASGSSVSSATSPGVICPRLSRRKAFFTAFRFFFRAEALHQFTHGDNPLCLRFEILHTLCQNRIVQARCLRLEEILHQPSERRILLAFTIGINDMRAVAKVAP